MEFNKDGCFDEDTGAFKAPVDGAYVFSASAESHEKGVVVCSHIMIGNNSHTIIQGGYEGKSVCVLVHLDCDQNVWIKATSAADKYYSGRCSLCCTLVQTADPP